MEMKCKWIKLVRWQRKQGVNVLHGNSAKPMKSVAIWQSHFLAVAESQFSRPPAHRPVSMALLSGCNEESWLLTTECLMSEFGSFSVWLCPPLIK
jgi:hypothetical protein